MRGYTSADEWSGGAWLTSGNSDAVIFAGTKGRGNFWYGFSNGLVWPDEPPFPDFPPAPHDERGWWAESFEGVLYFYNPDDLAQVAAGTMDPSGPQPYAELSLAPYLWKIKEPWQKMRVGAVAFDRGRGILYIAEPFADGDQPVIHVFSVRPKSSGQQAAPALTTSSGPASTGTLSTTAGPAGQDTVPTPAGEPEPAARTPGFGILIAAAGIALVAVIRKIHR